MDINMYPRRTGVGVVCSVTVVAVNSIHIYLSIYLSIYLYTYAYLHRWPSIYILGAPV